MRDDERGQAATELALVLPLLVLLLLAVVQVTLIARDQVLVVHAAREAAREAAVDPRPAAIRLAARRAGGEVLKPERLSTEGRQLGGIPPTVTVEVAYRAPTDVPLIGPLLPDVQIRAKATMRRESRVVSAKSPTEVSITEGFPTFGSEPPKEEMGPGSPAR